MNVKLFGHRCLVEFYRPKTSKNKIIIPDTAQNTDTHRLGTVRFIGDGVVKGKAAPEPPLVKVGDVIMFQINGMMEATQKFVLDGKHYLNLLQGDLIARINGDELTAESMEMLGDYVLLKHFIRQQPGSTLFLPDNAVRQSAPDFIYFRCVKKSSTVDLAVEPGNEVVVNFGRLTPMFIVKRNEDGSIENQEFCYTRKEWVDGVVEKSPDDDTQQT